MGKRDPDRPRRARRFPAKKLLYVAAALALVLAIVIVTYSGGKVLPTWDDIFNRTGTGPEDTSALDDPGTLTAYFIDVGDGDCTLFTCGGQSLLIDSGEREYAGRVVTAIQDLGVKRLDYVMVTHAHSDHMGGMSAVMKKFDVGKVIVGQNAGMRLTPYYLSFMEELVASDLEVTEASPGTTFRLGGAVCRVIGPTAVSENENDNSLVATVTFGSMTYLMMGDAEQGEETALMDAYDDIRATVVKLGHHGSGTSSCAEFLRRVDPQTAIISCGDALRTGHPDPKTIDRLVELRIPYYITADGGTIVVSTDGTSYTINHEH